MSQGKDFFFSGSLGSLGPDPKKHAKKHGFLWLRTPMAPILLDGLGGIPPVHQTCFAGKKNNGSMIFLWKCPFLAEFPASRAWWHWRSSLLKSIRIIYLFYIYIYIIDYIIHGFPTTNHHSVYRSPRLGKRIYEMRMCNQNMSFLITNE